jgi:hypothetical protein
MVDYVVRKLGRPHDLSQAINVFGNKINCDLNFFQSKSMLFVALSPRTMNALLDVNAVLLAAV